MVCGRNLLPLPLEWNLVSCTFARHETLLLPANAILPDKHFTRGRNDGYMQRRLGMKSLFSWAEYLYGAICFYFWQNKCGISRISFGFSHYIELRFNQLKRRIIVNTRKWQRNSHLYSLLYVHENKGSQEGVFRILSYEVLFVAHIILIKRTYVC